MYISKNVVKPQGQAVGGSAPKDPNVTFVPTDDVLVFPQRDAGGINVIGDFVMKPGTKMFTVYMSSSKISAPFTGDGDEDNISIQQKFEGFSPGDDIDLLEFVQNSLGRNFIILYGSCSDAYRKMAGTKCAPMQLKPEGEDNNDGRGIKLNFMQNAKTNILPGRYTGSITVAEPFPVVLVTAVNVTPANGRIYQLPATAVTAAITIATNTLEHGDTFTLIGGGGVDPATLASALTDKKAALKEGVAWVALLNAAITLKVFKAGATTLYTEVSRT